MARLVAVPFSAVEEKQVLRTFGLDGFVSRTARAPYFSPAFELYLHFLEIATRETTKRTEKKRREGTPFNQMQEFKCDFSLQ